MHDRHRITTITVYLHAEGAYILLRPPLNLTSHRFSSAGSAKVRCATASDDGLMGTLSVSETARPPHFHPHIATSLFTVMPELVASACGRGTHWDVLWFCRPSFTLTARDAAYAAYRPTHAGRSDLTCSSGRPCTRSTRHGTRLIEAKESTS